ncbi:hypothetical protein CVT24_001392 [Panaeolus cyanescens]|uniref:BED-type domain-containing protein n=1 Tax=Panaeolus cyanescens TaxID=181874 RepID=A0A409YYV3_9AGAR|nr:hypothetical protein CVT24_001392 [Panaeolus cyanescens]
MDAGQTLSGSCTCQHVSVCRCGVHSRWYYAASAGPLPTTPSTPTTDARYSIHSHYTPYFQSHSQTPFIPHIQSLYQASHPSSPTPITIPHFQPTHTNPSHLPPNATPLSSTTPFINVTNTPTTTSAPQPSKRKRATNSTRAGQSKRARVSASQSTTSATTARPPINTATTVGVGPVVEPPISNQSNPPESTSTDPLWQEIHASLDPNAPGTVQKRNDYRARNVWFFMIPVESNIRPDNLPEAGPAARAAILVKPKSPYVRCRLCQSKWQVFKNGTGGVTSTLRAHLETHGDLYFDLVKHFSLRDLGGAVPDDNEPFSLDRWIELLLDWIIADDQSLNVIECPEFRRWALYGREGVTDKDLPHRTAITNLIHKMYTKEHEELKLELKQALSRISFTSDMWSDPLYASFLAVTCHFAVRNSAGHLEIANRLLAFRLVTGSHEGDNVGQVMYDIVKEADIHHKMGQWTLDNAGTCNTSMEKIKQCCDKDFIMFSADGNRIRCFAHIINIAAQTIVKEFKENPDQVISEDERLTMLDDVIADRKAYQEALLSDPPGKARKIVSECRSSGREVHGLGQPVRVTGTGIAGYGYGLGFPYPWAPKRAQKRPKRPRTGQVIAEILYPVYFSNNSPKTRPFWTFLGAFCA